MLSLKKSIRTHFKVPIFGSVNDSSVLSIFTYFVIQIKFDCSFFIFSKTTFLGLEDLKIYKSDENFTSKFFVKCNSSIIYGSRE